MRVLAAAFVLLACTPARAQTVTFESLMAELHDLDRLTRLPAPAYSTWQWSSTDRRTTTPDRPHWFANADGFGQEPVPNFAAVLRQPGGDGVGEYLVCSVDGPGAIVRGWSAGMPGTLRVWLDDADAPLFTGQGREFFARRSTALLPGYADLPADLRQLLQQEDADYLPVPFARRLRIVWTGRLSDVHFYQLQVRRYAAGVAVETFAPDAATIARLQEAAAWRAALAAGPDRGLAGPRENGWRCTLRPGETWRGEVTAAGGGALRLLRFALEHGGDDAWRTVVLRIRCDDSSVPQVEVPVGLLSGAGPGLPPLHSLACDTRAGLDCRWPMPFRRVLRLELCNWGAEPVGWIVRADVDDRAFDDGSLYFHALWRHDRDLHAQADRAPVDLPYVQVSGRGRLVGLACQLLNPPMHPSWRDNWWGEGDEKIRVDGAWSTIGTGSEDYFNYSWSHWRRFDAPYCGQPLTTGPGTCGFVSNHRLQVVDDLPFARELLVAMELWSHRDVAPLSYGRLAWFYAAPGAVTDHRALQPADVRPPALAPWPPGLLTEAPGLGTWRPGAFPGGARASAGAIDPARPCSITRSGAVLWWQAETDGVLTLPFAVDAAGEYLLRLCCVQHPGGPDVRVLLDGERLRRDERDMFALSCAFGERLEDLVFERRALSAGPHELQLVCPAGGAVGVDLVTVERQPPPITQLPGADEAELWPVLRRSDGVDVAIEHVGSDFSAQHRRAVRVQRVGDAVTFGLAALRPGRYRVVLRLSTGPDHGVVRVDWNGERAAPDVDLQGGGPPLGVREVELGERDLARPVALGFTLTGPLAAPPRLAFGVDCVLLQAR
ncbi:MAG: DUF2961 domain-containing protein [Planctomycetota bacterium]